MLQGSSKLKLSYLHRMYAAKLTSKEIDFILFLSLYQDNTGCVRGAYYQDVISALGISIQKYYDIMESLARKGLIRWSKNNYYDRDIEFIDNAFIHRDDFKAGYIKTSYALFKDAKFRKMRPIAKLIAIDFLRLCNTNNSSYKSGKENFFGRYTKELFHISERMFRIYLTQIRQFFSIGLKNHVYYITPLEATKDKVDRSSENDRCLEHLIQAQCRRAQGDSDTDNTREIKSIYHNYKFKLSAEMVIDIIGRALKQCMKLTNKGKNKCEWDKKINTAFVHKLVIQQLEFIQA